MQIYPERIALRLHGCPAQRFNTSKLDGHSAASVAAYLVETDRFDSPDGTEARYKRGASKASDTGVSRRAPFLFCGALCKSTPNASRLDCMVAPHNA
ncbi:MAG: hypothetical protein P8123_07590 [bacterium]